MPDRAARLAILKAGLRKTPVEKGVDLEKLAELTNGYSGSDLAGMLQLAVKISVRKRIQAVHNLRDRILSEAQAKEKAQEEDSKTNDNNRMTPKKAMAMAKEKLLKAGEWTIKGEDLSKAFTLQRKSIKPADLDDYNAYAKRLQSKMGISSQLTTNSTDISGMFELPEGETNKNHFDTLPPLK
jgi:transitional endoplasmic reticulum ATPase